jgi:hypothetical protein
MALETDQIGRFTEVYTSFSGSDIVATFGGQVIGTLLGISWSITREKMPVFTMGSPSPRSFTRGKRGIAGSLQFQTFDRPALYELLARYADTDQIKYFTRSSNILPGFDKSNNITHRGITPTNEQSLDIRSAMPYYADQIPPFDVTLTFANEYGQAAVRSIYGVELLNEGSGASMDDASIEEAMTYVARDIGPLFRTGQPRDGFLGTSSFDGSADGQDFLIP